MIYFARCSATGLTKIGFSSSMESLRKRMASLQVGSGSKLALVFVKDGDKRDERSLHKRFVKSHSHGEWFRLGDEDLLSVGWYHDYQAPSGPDWKPPPKKTGPKPRPPEETLSATYLLRARPDQLDAYRAAAEALGVSLGEWVRTRLDHAVQV